MLYYDGSEARVRSRLPADVIAYGKPYPELEALTGADFIIVPEISIADQVRLSERPLPILAKELELSVPEVVKLKQLDAQDVLISYSVNGAALVQRKSGMDLLNSLGERLNDCLARMHIISMLNCQRILLYTGQFEHKGRALWYNGNITPYRWDSFMGALIKFQDRGGILTNLPADSDILDWIKLKERNLREYQTKAEKSVYATPCYPPDAAAQNGPTFQMPITVRDARLTLNTFPGLGPSKINALWEYVRGVLGYTPALYDLLRYATSPETAKYVGGWGAKIIQNNREWLGLDDGYLSTSDHNVTIQREKENG